MLALPLTYQAVGVDKLLEVLANLLVIFSLIRIVKVVRKSKSLELVANVLLIVLKARPFLLLIMIDFHSECERFGDYRKILVQHLFRALPHLILYGF